MRESVRAWTVHTQANRAKKNLYVMSYVCNSTPLFSPESASITSVLALCANVAPDRPFTSQTMNSSLRGQFADKYIITI